MAVESARIRDRSNNQANCMRGLTPKEYYADLLRASVDTPCLQTVRNYYKKLDADSFRLTSRKPPGRPPNAATTRAVVQEIERDPYSSEAKITKLSTKLRTSVRRHVQKYIHHIKYRIKAVTHTLKDEQKRVRVTEGKKIRSILKANKRNKWAHIFTDDESQFTFEYHHNHIWVNGPNPGATRTSRNHWTKKVM
ncbi:hypothetical protein BLNAU_11600 [Blattamonas nauphoetae]|uniref:Transposase n=1 Tax=Blattamonas nauphoetae TaxID=2049346 RepID=A0ABQ9XM37_9EUKA|nr:hypothetical protein BLNAU_11600 [Blattamonas nauphoetae]